MRLTPSRQPYVITRRTFVTALCASASWAQSTAGPKKTVAPQSSQGEIVRYYDPVTENVIARLTDPRTNSVLPAAQNRFVSSRNHFLLFSSDRTGKMEPYHLDLRSGAIQQVAHTAQLDPKSLCMDARERYLYLLDGQMLKEIALSNLKQRTIADGVTTFGIGALATDLVLVKAGGLERLAAGKATPIAENAIAAIMRPEDKGCAFWRTQAGETEIWYAPFPPPEAKPKLLASGPLIDPTWAPSGESVLFLREIVIPPGDEGAEPVRTSEIREVALDSLANKRVASTSQFAAFALNANGSVFVGASRSKAQPTVLLLLRSTGREFTLCEHRSANAAAVSPVFSPNSQRVYFQSDREGKWALYSVNLEKLVEPTTG